jgi:hypothetical protein
VRNRTRGRRAAARLATIALGVALPVLTVAGPALALKHDDGDATSYPSLGAGLTILYYVVIPLGAFLVIAALAVLPSTLSRPRYRPGKPWEHGSTWFGGPADGEGGDPAADSARGGASAEW